MAYECIVEYQKHTRYQAQGLYMCQKKNSLVQQLLLDLHHINWSFLIIIVTWYLVLGIVPGNRR